MSELVEIIGLSKAYGKKRVISDISLTLGSGRIIGLLGPNGSGKTTLIKILSGLIQDYEGTVRIDGNKPGVYTKSIVSYLPERTYLNASGTVMDTIRMFDDFYSDFDRDKAIAMTEDFKLDKGMRIKTMSKGMKEKLQIMLVMSREARLYLLDEPLGGVDPVGRDYILDTIVKNYNGKSTVLLSTHLIHDVERIFDRAVFIKDGSVIINEDVDILRDERGSSLDELFREVYR